MHFLNGAVLRPDSAKLSLPGGTECTWPGARIAWGCSAGWTEALCWQRSLPGIRVERILLAGQRLIIVGRDGDVLSIDALYGDEWRVLSPVGGSPRAVAVAGDGLVVWTEDRVGGYDAATFTCRWMRASRGMEDWTQVSGSDWVAFRERGEKDWRLVDARTGDPVFPGGLGSIGTKVTAAVLDGGRLLTAGFERRTASGDGAALVTLTAFKPDGQRAWQREIKSLIRVNETQLRASPDLIPVLVGAANTSIPRRVTTMPLPCS